MRGQVGHIEHVDNIGHVGTLGTPFIRLLKDALKSFDDFKNKQQKCMDAVMFFDMNLLKVYSIYYTLR